MSARVSTSSEEVRNFNKQNKYATSWAPFKTTPVPLPMARDRSWQKSCSSRSTYRVHIGSVCTAFDSFHHSSQPGVLCPLFAFATFFPSFYSSFPKQRHISTHDPADRAPKERSPQAASLDKSSWNMIEHVSKQLWTCSTLGAVFSRSEPKPSVGHPCSTASHRNRHIRHRAPDFDEGGDEGRPEDFNRCPRTALEIEEIHWFGTDSELIQMNPVGLWDWTPPSLLNVCLTNASSDSLGHWDLEDILARKTWIYKAFQVVIS
jgi:hypothetical protein